MGIEINLLPTQDPGTGRVEQANEPVSYTQPIGTEPSKRAKQQPAEVVYKEEFHDEDGVAIATGLVEQVSEPTVYEDPAFKGIREAQVKTKATKKSAVEDKSLVDAENKSKKKKSSDT